MATQFSKPRPVQVVGRILLILVVQMVAFSIMAWLLVRVQVESISSVAVAVLAIGLLNALLWPILSYIMVPFAVFTLGLFALILNGFIVWLAAEFTPGFSVEGFWSAFWLSIGMTAVTLILSSLLTIDDDTAWHRNKIKRRMKRIAHPESSDIPGVIFLEIDGLAKPILEQAIRDGHMPNLGRWIETGSHVLTRWETDTSSQTSASQAGILHGNNTNIPAFRWYDKTTGQVIASSNPRILPKIEAARSDGQGLLSVDGASRGNLFTGDANYVMTTASAITDRSKFHTSNFQAYFVNPYNAASTLLRFIWDIVLEFRQFRQARRDNVEPILDKHHRGRIYPLIRAAMTVILLDLNIDTLMGDMFAGRSAAYATFVGYDEIAHHSGILDPGAFDILQKIDREFRRLESAIPFASRPYHLVVLSDHGQTGGATFKQRYGMSLQEFIQELMAEKGRVGDDEPVREHEGHLNVLLSDIIQNDKSRVTRDMASAIKNRTVDPDRVTDPSDLAQDEREALAEEDSEAPAVYALASGNLGLISFTQWPQRMTLEEIDEAFPAVIQGLAQHEGIGFVMVRSKEKGPLAIGAHGIYYLIDDRVEGENPLADFGLNAAAHLRRTDSFTNCPDLVVNSFYNAERNEGCAFEELIGFHGGMGGTQSQPFILHPAEFKVDRELLGASSVYQICKEWLAQLNR